MALRTLCAAAICGLLAAAAPAAAGARAAAGGDLWVDRSAASCSDAYVRAQVTQAAPWCSIGRAAALALAGDTVHVMPGTYRESVRPAASGTQDAPVTYRAEGAVTIDAAGAQAAVRIISVSWIVLDGFTVTGAAAEGIWLDSTHSVTLENLVVSGNPGNGIALRATQATAVTGSTLSGNGAAGALELAGSADDVFDGDVVSANGVDGKPYNGDGIQFAGARTTVRSSTITGNGDPGPYEHGIYAATGASDYLIEGNAISGNAAADVKAMGSGGTIRYNRLGGARYGLVFSDNATPVTAYENVVSGRFQHAVFVTTGTTPAQVRLWANTIVQTGRSTASGDASVVFVNSASSLDVRDDLLCYTAADNLGSALWVNNAALVGSLVSDANWLCSTDAQSRHLAWNGSRVTLAQWRVRSGQDARSIGSPPPAFDADLHVVSANLGARLGIPLGIPHDVDGVPLPASPDVGAHQQS